MPVVKNDLKLCVNHRFIAPSLYSQINPADLYDRCIYTKDKMYNAFWRHAFLDRGHSFSVKIFDRSHSSCQVIRLGAADDFRGPSGQALLLPFHVSLSCARSFLRLLSMLKLLQGSKLEKSSGRLLATNWRNIVARCKFLVASSYNVNDTARSQGFWYFTPSQSREIHKNTQNTVKFSRNLIKYMSVQHIWNLFQL